MILLFLLLWPPNGIFVYVGDGAQANPWIVHDGSGGVYVAWDDNRNGDYDIYMQRVDSAGNKVWSSEAELICGSGGHQFGVRMTEDGKGNAILCWIDAQSKSNFNIHAQKVDSLANCLWGDGVIVCNIWGSQFFPSCIPDENGGMIVGWQDHRGSSNDIYMQRLDSSGSSCWQANGLPVCVYSGRQDHPILTALGNDNFLVLWEDRRDGDYDIYGQRFDLEGTMYWEQNGKKLVSFSSHQSKPEVVAVDESSFVIVWEDCQSGDIDVYAQKFNWQGIAQWPLSGIGVGIGFGYQRDAQLATDGAGGVFVCWEEYADEIKVYCQYLDVSGNKLWGSDGLMVTPYAEWHYHNPRMVLNNAGGVIIQWNKVNNETIHAQSLDSLGNFLWPYEGVTVLEYNVFLNEWYHIITDGLGGFYSVWTGLDPDIFLQRIYFNGSTGILKDETKQVFSITISPNPAKKKISFIFPSSDVDLEIYDVIGRKVFNKSIKGYNFTWNFRDSKGQELPAGVYFVTLETPNFVETEKVILVK